jgi:hypothetical protein
MRKWGWLWGLKLEGNTVWDFGDEIGYEEV